MSNSGEGIFSIIEIGKDYFDKAKYDYNVVLNIDTISITKRDGQIKIPIRWIKDSNLIYKDKNFPNNEEANITYNYLGYYRDIDMYLIETRYYEAIEYCFVSPNGSITTIWGKPIVSNDGKYFACFRPYGLEGEPNGIQIWKVKSDLVLYEGLYKIFEMNQLLFSPINCCWDINGSLLMQAEKMQSYYYPKEPNETYYLKLEFK